MPTPDPHAFDAIVIGGGAAGLFCAGVAGQMGLKVLVIDHAAKVAEKVRIAGGGRCNFTNRDLDPRAPQRHFLGENPQFCRSALSRYTAQEFIDLVRRHGIPFHEKHKGQLFGDRSSEDFIQMLLAECAAGGVERWQPCAVKALRHSEGEGYAVDTDRGTVRAPQLVVATGGLAIPQIGASDFGYRVARQFGLRIAQTRPALVPLTFDAQDWAPWSELAGLSLPVRIEAGPKASAKKDRSGAGAGAGGGAFGAFEEDLLFTHRGLSGPGVLQISSYWRPGTPIRLDLAPGRGLGEALALAKAASRRLIANELAGFLPSRLAEAWARQDSAWQRPVNEASDKSLAQLAQRIGAWELTPTGTEGYKKAEVTAGGVDTRELSQQTMESRQKGLYFIGEVVDITGWLGGYNFQWAWSSAWACAQGMAASRTG